MNPYRFVYGLTGVIGSGKSSVADIFEQEGCLVLRADNLAREAVSEEYDNFSHVKEKLEKAFKTEILNDSNQNLFDKKAKLNRNALRRLVFQNEKALSKLNKIIHPEVRRIFKKKITEAPKESIIIYDVPLLYETKLNKKVREIIVVYCDEKTAIKRAAKRMKLHENEIENILKRQISIEKKRKSADHVIDNNKKLIDTKKQVINILKNLHPKGD